MSCHYSIAEENRMEHKLPANVGDSKNSAPTLPEKLPGMYSLKNTWAKSCKYLSIVLRMVLRIVVPCWEQFQQNYGTCRRTGTRHQNNYDYQVPYFLVIIALRCRMCSCRRWKLTSNAIHVAFHYQSIFRLQIENLSYLWAREKRIQSYLSNIDDADSTRHANNRAENSFSVQYSVTFSRRFQPKCLPKENGNWSTGCHTHITIRSADDNASELFRFRFTTNIPFVVI